MYSCRLVGSFPLANKIVHMVNIASILLSVSGSLRPPRNRILTTELQRQEYAGYEKGSFGRELERLHLFPPRAYLVGDEGYPHSAAQISRRLCHRNLHQDFSK